jgi:nicotinamide-nucleotide amidase
MKYIDMYPLVFELAEALKLRKLHVAVAESCTGGLIGSLLTDIPGSSIYFSGGIIAYSNSIKEQLLRVPAEVLTKHGAVSSQTVECMVQGIICIFGTECGVAVSGIAGPDGGTTEKPVGTVYVGIAAPKGIFSYRYYFTGGRTEIRKKTAAASLQRLLEIIS